MTKDEKQHKKIEDRVKMIEASDALFEKWLKLFNRKSIE